MLKVATRTTKNQRMQYHALNKVRSSSRVKLNRCNMRIRKIVKTRWQWKTRILRQILYRNCKRPNLPKNLLWKQTIRILAKCTMRKFPSTLCSSKDIQTGRIAVTRMRAQCLTWDDTSQKSAAMQSQKS